MGGFLDDRPPRSVRRSRPSPPGTGRLGRPGAVEVPVATRFAADRRHRPFQLGRDRPHARPLPHAHGKRSGEPAAPRREPEPPPPQNRPHPSLGADPVPAYRHPPTNPAAKPQPPPDCPQSATPGDNPVTAPEIPPRRGEQRRSHRPAHKTFASSATTETPPKKLLRHQRKQHPANPQTSDPLPNLLHTFPAAPDTASPTSLNAFVSGSVDEFHDSLYDLAADLRSSFQSDAGESASRRA